MVRVVAPGVTGRRVAGRRRAAAVALLLTLAATGCGSRQLTEEAPTDGATVGAVSAAVVLTTVLLVVHVARLLLGRWPRGGDGSALLLTYEGLLALVACALIVLVHVRAEDLLSTPVGDEPRVIVAMHAECGVTTGDDFLEFHTNYDSCDVNQTGLFLIPPLGALGVGLLMSGRGLRAGARGSGPGILALLAALPLGALAAVGLGLVAPDLASALFWAGAAGLPLGVVAGLTGTLEREAEPPQSLR